MAELRQPVGAQRPTVRLWATYGQKRTFDSLSITFSPVTQVMPPNAPHAHAGVACCGLIAEDLVAFTKDVESTRTWAVQAPPSSLTAFAAFVGLVPDDAHLLLMVVSPSSTDERHPVRVVDVRESKGLYWRQLTSAYIKSGSRVLGRHVSGKGRNEVVTLGLIGRTSSRVPSCRSNVSI